MSIGGGFDVGAGATTGGQATVGITDSGGNVGSAGAVKGKLGLGVGFSIGFDTCWTELRCKEKEYCDNNNDDWFWGSL
jgi:hypothetical protein